MPRDADGQDDAALWNRIELLASQPGQLTAEQYTSVQGFIRRVAGRYAPPEQLDDLVSEVILRWLRAVEAGKLNASGRPAGYLMAIARNAAIDSSRSRQRMSSGESSWLPAYLEELANVTVSDDDVAKIVERRATGDSVRQALRACRQNGDITAYRVATYLLDHAESTGDLPSTRQTGAALGLSHTGVAGALKRLRPYLQGQLDVG